MFNVSNLEELDAVQLFFRRGGIKDTEVNEGPVTEIVKVSNIQIIEPKRYEKIKSVHNAAVEVLKKPELLWENTVEAKSRILALAF